MTYLFSSHACRSLPTIHWIPSLGIGFDSHTGLCVFFEKSRNTQEEKGGNHKHDKDVEKMESAPGTGCTAKTTGRKQGDLVHKGNGVEGRNTRHVKEQVSKSNLERINRVGNHGGRDARQRRSNIGSQGQGEHLLQTKSARRSGDCCNVPISIYNTSQQKEVVAVRRVVLLWIHFNLRLHMPCWNMLLRPYSKCTVSILNPVKRIARLCPFFMLIPD